MLLFYSFFTLGVIFLRVDKEINVSLEEINHKNCHESFIVYVNQKFQLFLQDATRLF